MTTTEHIARRLLTAGLTIYGTAALMGNLQAESALISTNLQNCYNQSIGMTDEQYTDAVDDGKYTNFVHDSAGYGIAQWTYWTRKRDLLHFAKSAGKSIGDLDMQLDFLVHELKEDYPKVLEMLCTTDDLRAASDAVMCRYENPADQSEGAKAYRAQLGCKILEQIRRMETESPAKPSDSHVKGASELAAEVIAGKWGNGAERRERLTAAGYDYDKVQGEVNRVLDIRERLTYTVQKGDTLTRIAKRFGTSVDRLAEMNGIQNPDRIFAGDALTIPEV